MFRQEIALLEIDASMTIIHTQHSQGTPSGWTAAEAGKDTQTLRETYGGELIVLPSEAIYAVSNPGLPASRSRRLPPGNSPCGA